MFVLSKSIIDEEYVKEIEEKQQLREEKKKQEKEFLQNEIIKRKKEIEDLEMKEFLLNIILNLL